MNSALAENIVTGEMLGVIEHWRSDGDATHVLLADPRPCGECREPHTWFINRDGRTRCCQCDDRRCAELAKSQRRGLLMSAREAFRIFRGQA